MIIFKDKNRLKELNNNALSNEEPASNQEQVVGSIGPTTEEGKKNLAVNANAKPAKPQYTRTQIATANSPVLQMFKDGTVVKNFLLTKTVPINDVFIKNGNIVIESKHETTNRILESLNIECPDFLFLKEAKYIKADGQTNLNGLFSDDVQQVLNATGKQITWIHNENGQVVLYDSNKKNYTLDSIKQEAEQLAQKAKEEAAQQTEEPQAEANEEAKQQSSQNTNVVTKMPKQYINAIATNVLNALNSKLSKANGYNVTWEIVPEGFDTNTLQESKLNEDIKRAFSNVKTKIGTALGTKTGRQNMSNRSVPTTFAVKPTFIGEDGNELTPQDGVNYENEIKNFWKAASKILNNYTEIMVSDSNGQQYKTKATFQLQPNIKNGVFIYKTVADVLPNSSADAQTQGQSSNNQTQNNNQPQQQQSGKNNKPFWWDQASKRQQKKYIKNVTSSNNSKGGGFLKSLGSGASKVRPI